MTRADLRASLRLALEDSSSSPLFSDAVLNEALSNGVERYGVMVPEEATVLITLTTGAKEVTHTGLRGLEDERHIRRVLDGRGRVLDRLYDVPDDWIPTRSDGVNAWRFHQGGLVLAFPASVADGGQLRVELVRGRTLSASDGDPVSVGLGHEPAVIAFALAWAYRRQGMAEAKRDRRAGAGYERMAMASEQDGVRLLGMRRRVARGGMVGG